MGGCRSKLRVVKEPDQQYYEHSTAPEAVVGHNNNEAISESDHQPQADHEDGAAGGQVSVLHEILHVDLDNQSNKRPSLSSLFHQSEDQKAKTGSENNEGEEKLKEEEASEREEKGSNNEVNEGMKQESQVREAKHKWAEETQNSNKAAEKCEGNSSEQKMQAEATTCKIE